MPSGFGDGSGGSTFGVSSSAAVHAVRSLPDAVFRVLLISPLSVGQWRELALLMMKFEWWKVDGES